MFKMRQHVRDYSKGNLKDGVSDESIDRCA